MDERFDEDLDRDANLGGDNTRKVDVHNRLDLAAPIGKASE